jgi:predicted MFS family arabinose efflux permease
LHPPDKSLGVGASGVATAGAVGSPALHPRPLSQPTARQRIALALLAAVFAVHFLDRQLLAILIPPIKAELGLSDTALGFLSGFAFTLFSTTVGLVIARLADRADRARIITWSLVAFSATTALCGLVTTFWQLALARIGVGAGEGGTNPASHSLIMDTFPAHYRATAMAIYGLGPNLGIVLAFGIGGWLAQTAGWRAAFFFAGLLGLLVALATRAGLRDPRSQTPVPLRADTPSAIAVTRAMFASPTQRHLLAAATLATAAATGVVTWLPALLTRVHGFSLAQAGIFLAAVLGMMGAAGSYACGRLSDRASTVDPRRKLFVLAGLQCFVAVTLPFGLLADSDMLAALLLSVPCVVLAAYVGPTLAVVQSVVDPRARAFSAAILLLCVNLVGAGIGPFAVGMLSDMAAPSEGSASLRHALFLAPGLCLWSALHYWRAAPTLVAAMRT